MSYAYNAWGDNGFVLLVVLFVLLIIVGGSYQGFGYGY
ncbi:YjcZ family sporulation protein [Aquibacillus salsiterrae]|uniref:YjcZ family sporulation protein n=1 Tax=Aquibacillus salsiterrae TaxID=2950439 RepID=A0A9X3WGX4_9BACI|nr:YjcZ family sporulation protein [Aquibacillus salsiterrae]MDC3418206.1 YjcZ family sporulation protein [Aquibacillus salsiterrae]